MFRPKLIPTVASAIGLSLTLSLGNWQVGRHAERNADLYRVAELSDVTLGCSDVDPTDVTPLRLRRVKLTGSYRHEAMLLSGQSDRSRLGYRLFDAIDSDCGRWLIDRGWVPHDELATILEGLPRHDEPVTIEGQLRAINGDPSAVPYERRIGPASVWPPGARQAMAHHTTSRNDLFIVSGPERTDNEKAPYNQYPIDGYTAPSYDPTSLHYAIQWFLCSAVLALFWLYSTFRRR